MGGLNWDTFHSAGGSAGPPKSATKTKLPKGAHVTFANRNEKCIMVLQTNPTTVLTTWLGHIVPPSPEFVEYFGTSRDIKTVYDKECPTAKWIKFSLKNTD